MEKEAAKQMFEEAIQKGHTAYMASYDEDDAQDKVILKIGNL